MTKLPLIFSLFLLLVFVPSLSLNSQRSILLSIKQQWGNLPAMSTWVPDTTPCSWAGIQCSMAARDKNTTKLVTGIDLYNAGLNSSIPPSICDLKTLKTLNLGWNNVPGRFPTDLYRCSALTYLNLSRNMFVGSIPGDVDKLLPPSLQYLDLSSNQFTRDIPRSIGRLTELKTLYLTNNLFNGTYPSEISNLSKLEDLQMATNPFTRMALPSEWGKLKNLKFLFMKECNIVGQIPETFGGLVSLEHLDLAGNGLVGRIPDGLFLLKSLRILYLYSNSLSGEIPRSVQALNLTDIDLYHNSLSGSIPEDFGKLKRLRLLSLSNNTLSGVIPQTIGLLPELEYIKVFYNNLYGHLPPKLGLHSAFRTLEIAGNQFSGPLPENLCSRASLLVIAASSNHLSGGIPKSLGSCTTLHTLSISDNSFTGPIATTVGLLSTLHHLDLSSNKFSGPIPAAIVSLPSLYSLNLSNNELSGPIPAVIGSLPMLTTLDLSSNDLSGEIPAQFYQLKLTFLNLSNNNLCTSYTSQKLNLPRCSSSLASFLFKHLALALVPVFAMIASSVIIYIVVFAIRKTKRRKHIDDLPTRNFTPLQKLGLTEDIIISSLCKQNVIGRGGSGEVYRVQGDSGNSVAVKMIWNNNCVNNEQFLAEVETLENIRHANIVRLFCNIPSANTNLLVYQYLENQSLDRWLHRRRRLDLESRGESVYVLDWPTRFKIAIGVARGLSYMHHEIVPPIIHRDIKSSNILLDSEFNAKIADFGLARVNVKQGELDTSRVAGTFGYMAPEYMQAGKVNEKIDVFSFGVVLLELATGREPIVDEISNLAGSLWKDWSEKKPIVDCLDEEVMRHNYLKQMTTVFRLGIRCTNKSPDARPSMEEVVQALRRSSPLKMTQLIMPFSFQ